MTYRFPPSEFRVDASNGRVLTGGEQHEKWLTLFRSHGVNPDDVTVGPGCDFRIEPLGPDEAWLTYLTPDLDAEGHPRVCYHGNGEHTAKTAATIKVAAAEMEGLL